ncbi:GFA family protein [Streptomyces sp. NPDC002917]|uniref:GFA family protein n=1 Tax=Streptomyces sp. NPDC002917 TaxID=3364671 RepID=UPI0036A4B443
MGTASSTYAASRPTPRRNSRSVGHWAWRLGYLAGSTGGVPKAARPSRSPRARRARILYARIQSASPSASPVNVAGATDDESAPVLRVSRPGIGHDTLGHPTGGPLTGDDLLSTIPDTTVRVGGCLCGQIRFAVASDPDYPHVCSCTHCKKLSGGPMMAWVSFDLDGFTWTGPRGEPSWHYTWPDSKRGFCPSCGSQVCAQDDGADSIALAFFALDDPTDLIPVNQSFRDGAVSWLPQIRNAQHSTALSPEPPR